MHFFFYKNLFVLVCPGSVGTGSHSSSKYDPSLFYACLHVWLNVSVSHGSILLNVVVLFLLLRECGARTVHMCLGFHASVLCFSTHAAWLLISSCLISNEKRCSPRSLYCCEQLITLIKITLKFMWLISWTYVDTEMFPKPNMWFLWCFQAAWMLFVCGLNSVFFFLFHSYCPWKTFRIHSFFLKV